MFVTVAQYKEALDVAKARKRRAEAYEYEAERLLVRWNDLVERINAKGGQEFLDRAVIPSETSSQFTQAEIMVLIRLCHPDRHNNSNASNDITKKLLALRK